MRRVVLIASWIIMAISALCNTLYSFMSHRVELIFVSVCEIGMLIVIIILGIRYNRCTWIVKEYDLYWMKCDTSCGNSDIYPHYGYKPETCRFCGRKIDLRKF